MPAYVEHNRILADITIRQEAHPFSDLVKLGALRFQLGLERVAGSDLSSLNRVNANILSTITRKRGICDRPAEEGRCGDAPS